MADKWFRKGQLAICFRATVGWCPRLWPMLNKARQSLLTQINWSKSNKYHARVQVKISSESRSYRQRTSQGSCLKRLRWVGWMVRAWWRWTGRMVDCNTLILPTKKTNTDSWPTSWIQFNFDNIPRTTTSFPLIDSSTSNWLTKSYRYLTPKSKYCSLRRSKPENRPQMRLFKIIDRPTKRFLKSTARRPSC